MIAISKNEKELINARFPSVHIVRTMKQKSNRHHYYCEESRPVMKMLRRLRGDDRGMTRKGGASVGHRKKAK